MTIYLVIIEDRHVDVEIKPFRDKLVAIDCAKQVRDGYFADRRVRGYEPPEQYPINGKGCHFKARLSDEGDYVSVIEVELR